MKVAMRCWREDEVHGSESNFEVIEEGRIECMEVKVILR